MNAIRWSLYGRSGDLRDEVRPEDAQPNPTAFERAAEAGLDVWMCSAPNQAGSGLTRAVLRGAKHRTAQKRVSLANFHTRLRRAISRTAERCRDISRGDAFFAYPRKTSRK